MHLFAMEYCSCPVYVCCYPAWCYQPHYPAYRERREVEYDQRYYGPKHGKG